MTDREQGTPALFEAAIGPRGRDYYLPYFGRAERRGYAPLSWNWPAFLFGFFWFLYRKLYLWALVVFCYPTFAMLLAGAVANVWPNAYQPVLLTLIFGFHMIYLPLNANGIYYRWARREVGRARNAHPGQPAAQIEQLAAVGGCNTNLPFLILGTFALLSLVLGSFVPG